MTLSAVYDRSLEIKYYISDYVHSPLQTYKMSNQIYIWKERTINFYFVEEECTHMPL